MAKQRPLDPFALVIGRVCIAWDQLETMSQHLYASVSGMPIGAVSAHMTSCLELRDVMKALRIGAIVDTESDPDGRRWAEALIESIDYIDNTLRPMRNRLVHDSWYVDLDDSVYRFTYAPRIVREQARQPLKVTPGHKTKQTPREGQLLVKEILAQADWLSNLYKWRINRERYPVEALLSERPQLRLLPDQPGKPNPLDNGKLKRKPPPRSSRE